MLRATAAPETVIGTARLVMRPTRRADIDDLVDGISDLAVSRMLSRVPYPYTSRDALAFLNAVAASRGRDLPLAITLDNRVIGGIGLSGLNTEREFGYWLARAHWGKGYATEAGRAFLDHLFDTHDIDVVRSGVFVGNQASLRVQEKLGFIEIGRSERHCLARGETLAHIDTVLTRERYETLAV